MTGQQFKRLHRCSEIEMDGKNYRVIDTDNLGRVEMRQIVYYINTFDERDNKYDTYEDCVDALQVLLREQDFDSDLSTSDIEEELESRVMGISGQ